MPLEKNRFLNNIRQGILEHLYVIGTYAIPEHVEFVCQSGKFSTIWFDLEHYDISLRRLANLKMVAQAYPITILARLYVSDYTTVMRVLETGVDGIICAMVNTREQAENIVRWSRFKNPAPKADEVTGIRGWNAGGVDSRYATLPIAEYLDKQNNETAILCQIETEQAIQNVEEIVSVAGVNGLFFGPGDFAQRIGRIGETDHPDVISSMKIVDAACCKYEKWWGTVASNPQMYAKVRNLGAKFICPGGDARVMIAGLRALVRNFESFETDSQVPTKQVNRL